MREPIGTTSLTQAKIVKENVSPKFNCKKSYEISVTTTVLIHFCYLDKGLKGYVTTVIYKVSRSQVKIDEKFANHYLNTKANNKGCKVPKCTCKGLHKSINELKQWKKPRRCDTSKSTLSRVIWNHVDTTKNSLWSTGLTFRQLSGKLYSIRTVYVQYTYSIRTAFRQQNGTVHWINHLFIVRLLWEAFYKRSAIFIIFILVHSTVLHIFTF